MFSWGLWREERSMSMTRNSAIPSAHVREAAKGNLTQMISRSDSDQSVSILLPI